jgi:hypothetical protein
MQFILAYWSSYVEILQTGLNRLGEWAVQHTMTINPTKSVAVSFTRDWVMKRLNYLLRDIVIPEASSCKYLGIILRKCLSWTDQINYMVKKAWKAVHFTMRILKQGCGTQTFSLHITSASNSWIWGGVLGSLQEGTDKCARPNCRTVKPWHGAER